MSQSPPSPIGSEMYYQIDSRFNIKNKSGRYQAQNNQQINT